MRGLGCPTKKFACPVTETRDKTIGSHSGGPTVEFFRLAAEEDLGWTEDCDLQIDDLVGAP